jgi:hypothetical protein
MSTWKLAQGTGASWTVPIVDEDNGALSYVGSETLSGSVWPGGTRLALATLTPTWLDPEEGTTTVTISESVTADLLPAVYSVRCTITDASGTREYYVGRLEIIASPGTSEAPPSYITDLDLRDFAAWIDDLQAESDQTGFARQCSRARAWLDEILIGRYKPGSGGQLGDPGYGSWDAGSSVPSQWLRDQLADDRLMVRDITKEICAKRALGYICKAQLGRNNDHPYQDLAKCFLAESEELVKIYRAELDLDDDGQADLFIDCGASSLR